MHRTGMHLTARLNPVQRERFEYTMDKLGLSKSDTVREALERLYQDVTEEESRLARAVRAVS